MPKPKDPDDQLTPVTPRQTFNFMLFICDGAAALTEPFTSIFSGKHHFRGRVLLAGIILIGWMSAFPGQEAAVIAYGMAWLPAVCFQMLLSRWCHYFGRRRITTFVGVPLINYLLPFGEHLNRRLVTPLLVFGIGYLIENRALSLLIEFSGVGQAVSGMVLYAIKAADEDARSDAMLMMRSR